jgi:hypothetical protein
MNTHLRRVVKPEGKSAARGDDVDSERMGSTAPAWGVSRVSLIGVSIYPSSSVLIPQKAGSALLYNIP